MSQPGLTNSANPQLNLPPQKQGFNVYSMMLVLSFIALVTGATLLANELLKYGDFPQWNTAGVATPAAGS